MRSKQLVLVVLSLGTIYLVNLVDVMDAEVIRLVEFCKV
jgi:hypothetical protein